MKFKEYRFDEITLNFDKKRIPLSAMQRSNRQGSYRYYGAQGIIDYLDDYIFDGTYLLIAEDGENLKSNKQNIAHLVTGRFWVNNHAHIIQTNKLCDLLYLYYAINLMDLSGYVTGSAQPKLSQANLNSIIISVPEINLQKKIVSILSALDDKIELNNAINKNLEEQAQALFKSWFVDFEPFGGVMPKGWNKSTLGCIASITSGKRPSIKQSEKTDDISIPIVGAASIMGYTKDVLYNEKILVTGRVGTHGVIQRFNAPCWTSDNTLVITSQLYEFVYQILKGIDYQNMNRGSTQPLITQTDLKNVEILIPSNEILSDFEQLVGSLMKQMEMNLIENNNLSTLRDTLLPKLMSGELDVSEIDI